MLKTSEILAEAIGIIRLALLITEPRKTAIIKWERQGNSCTNSLLRLMELKIFNISGSKIDKSAEL